MNHDAQNTKPQYSPEALMDVSVMVRELEQQNAALLAQIDELRAQRHEAVERANKLEVENVRLNEEDSMLRRRLDINDVENAELRAELGSIHRALEWMARNARAVIQREEVLDNRSEEYIHHDSTGPSIAAALVRLATEGDKR